MSSAQKTPYARTAPQLARNKVLDEIAKRGQGLPGHVVAVFASIVKINFDVSGVTLPQVTMPVAAPEYMRYPIQEGDQGVALPASVYLGGVTGLGGGTADTSLRGNLSSLIWFPVGSKNFPTSPAIDPDALTLYGPNGVVLRDAAGETTFTLTPSGLVVNAQTSITFQVGSKALVITAAGITIEGREFLTHKHVPGLYVVGSSPVTGDSGDVV